MRPFFIGFSRRPNGETASGELRRETREEAPVLDPSVKLFEGITGRLTGEEEATPSNSLD